MPGRYATPRACRPTSSVEPLLDEPLIARLVALSGQPLALDDAAHHESIGPLATRHGIRSLLAVPLVARERAIGVLLLLSAARPASFEAAEIDFAARLGTTVGLSLDNARLYAQQRLIAETLRENLIHPLPHIEGLELGNVAATAHAETSSAVTSARSLPSMTRAFSPLSAMSQAKVCAAAGLSETIHTASDGFALLDGSPEFILRKTNELLLAAAQRHRAGSHGVRLRPRPAFRLSSPTPAPAIPRRSPGGILDRVSRAEVRTALGGF